MSLNITRQMGIATLSSYTQTLVQIVRLIIQSNGSDLISKRELDKRRVQVKTLKSITLLLTPKFDTGKGFPLYSVSCLQVYPAFCCTTSKKKLIIREKK